MKKLFEEAKVLDENSAVNDRVLVGNAIDLVDSAARKLINLQSGYINMNKANAAIKQAGHSLDDLLDEIIGL